MAFRASFIIHARKRARLKASPDRCIRLDPTAYVYLRAERTDQAERNWLALSWPVRRVSARRNLWVPCSRGLVPGSSICSSIAPRCSDFNPFSPFGLIKFASRRNRSARRSNLIPRKFLTIVTFLIAKIFGASPGDTRS